MAGTDQEFDPDLFATGARVISVFGPFNSRTLIEVSTDLASKVFKDPLSRSGPTNVIDAVGRDLEAIRKLSPALAESALAATATKLAYELEDPYNSATSKSMCAKALNETLERLRELAPAAKEADGIDELSSRRAERLAGRAAS